MRRKFERQGPRWAAAEVRPSTGAGTGTAALQRCRYRSKGVAKAAGNPAFSRDFCRKLEAFSPEANLVLWADRAVGQRAARLRHTLSNGLWPGLKSCWLPLFYHGGSNVRHYLVAQKTGSLRLKNNPGPGNFFGCSKPVSVGLKPALKLCRVFPQRFAVISWWRVVGFWPPNQALCSRFLLPTATFRAGIANTLFRICPGLARPGRHCLFRSWPFRSSSCSKPL